MVNGRVDGSRDGCRDLQATTGLVGGDLRFESLPEGGLGIGQLCFLALTEGIPCAPALARLVSVGTLDGVW